MENEDLKPADIKHNPADIHNIDLDSPLEEVVVYDNWMDGFWLSIGGWFREQFTVDLQEHTFTEVGCQCLMPDTPFLVQKAYYWLTQPKDPALWNRASVSWLDGNLVIQVDVQEAPCTIKWFNIY